MPNSGICEKSPQFQHLAASLGFIKKIEKVAISVRNLIKKHRFRTPIATFCCLPAKLGSETQPNWVTNHSQIR